MLTAPNWSLTPGECHLNHRTRAPAQTHESSAPCSQGSSWFSCARMQLGEAVARSFPISQREQKDREICRGPRAHVCGSIRTHTPTPELEALPIRHAAEWSGSITPGDLASFPTAHPNCAQGPPPFPLFLIPSVLLSQALLYRGKPGFHRHCLAVPTPG